ncbi:ABC transporter ATP-binding protein [Cupriavidus sp. MP-37]|uniref:ABC transporter ATP-binding protein n=1 Tax=Cupriavidus sp. MP-37 TaxID=2884455 RepID=UPI001D09B9A7|nr:ABC transporter ATP-binding protein [Cupriavidus sp. MP-37]UDM49716.1 ABC transporter ATP-binding protein [Cupriavidus sp. MP-37]
MRTDSYSRLPGAQARSRPAARADAVDVAVPAPAPAPAVIEVERIRHAFGRHAVVKGLSFSVARGHIACLLGPSGCGKTTVLRAIAGFEPLQDGRIVLDGQTVSSSGTLLAPEQRRIGMVFQDYALFPHLDVAANVGFGLTRASRAERAARVDEVLQLVGLDGAGRQYPHELSGGQQQRVALARALAPRPELLLLDEPFSNLDVDLRERLSHEVRAILKAQGTTAILVTHDQHEAFAMADEIGVMHDGVIEQWGSAHDLYHRPATRFVAGFIGQGVLLAGRMRDAAQIELELGLLRPAVPLDLPAGAAVDVLVRPDDIVHDDASPMRAEVVHKAFRGAEILYTLRLASGGRVLALVPSHHNHAVGERIGIRVEIEDVVAFAA